MLGNMMQVISIIVSVYVVFCSAFFVYMFK